jgi:hypothetical protein
MKKITSLLFLFFSASTLLVAQIKTPDKKPFNIGIFSGVGGVNFTPIPGIDLHYKGTLLRIAPGYHVNSIGLIREIIPFSKVFYNCYWIGSLYGASGFEFNKYGSPDPTVSLRSDFTKGMLMTGAKVYFAKRWYSQLQAGLSYTKYKTPGYSDDKEYAPYFEFCLGINFFKNYLNETTLE